MGNNGLRPCVGTKSCVYRYFLCDRVTFDDLITRRHPLPTPNQLTPIELTVDNSEQRLFYDAELNVDSSLQRQNYPQVLATSAT
jgi:hypothetical protein